MLALTALCVATLTGNGTGTRLARASQASAELPGPAPSGTPRPDHEPGSPLAYLAESLASKDAAAASPASPTSESGPLYASTPGLSPSEVSPDVLVDSDTKLPARTVLRLRQAPGVLASTVLGMSSVVARGQKVTVGSVRPSTYRLFAPRKTAGAGGVWAAVTRGEAVVAHAVARRLDLPLGGRITLGKPNHRVTVRVGAFATTVPGIDVIVGRDVGQRLGVPSGTTMVLSGDDRNPARVAEAARKIVDGKAAVDVLARRPEKPVRQRASLTGTPTPVSGEREFLTGTEAARALGSFTYTYYPDGSIQPDPDWVAANIRTASVPILGEVTCHRLMFPQLRGALREVVRRGLADKIHPRQYGGCYVPRFIGSDPSNSISLHTWGIAVDLNVAGNQRGTRGQIDRRVVAIFKSWGFAWGGDWDWTDPMHFELAGVLQR